MWPTQLGFLFCIVCRIFTSCLILFNTSFLKRSVRLIFPILFSRITFKNFPGIFGLFLKCQSFGTIQSYAPNIALSSFFLKFKSRLLVKIVLFLLNPHVDINIFVRSNNIASIIDRYLNLSFRWGVHSDRQYVTLYFGSKKSNCISWLTSRTINLGIATFCRNYQQGLTGQRCLFISRIKKYKALLHAPNFRINKNECRVRKSQSYPWGLAWPIYMLKSGLKHSLLW